MFTKKDTVLTIKNVTNMWEYDPKSEFIHLVKLPGMFMPSSSFLILFPVGCVKLNLNRYIYVHEESQLYLHNADVIARSQL